MSYDDDDGYYCCQATEDAWVSTWYERDLHDRWRRGLPELPYSEWLHESVHDLRELGLNWDHAEVRKFCDHLQTNYAVVFSLAGEPVEEWGLFDRLADALLVAEVANGIPSITGVGGRLPRTFPD